MNILVDRRRIPGRYVVFSMLTFGVLFFAFMVVLAVRVTPAAERFHSPSPASKRG